MSLEVVAAGIEGVRLMLDWAAAEGWNPGLEDAEPFYATDPDGFLLARLDGVPVGSISVVRYPGDFAFLGFYIVRPEHRGRGFGMALWRTGMERLAGCNIGLDGVVAQQADYRKSGFALAHRNVRFGGVPRAAPLDDPRVVPLERVPLPELLAYDRSCFGFERRPFLERWIARPRIALGFLERGRLLGYGVIRACRQGFKIGPLFADRADAADALFLALAAQAGGQPVFLDPPEPNAEATALARRHGLEPVFETARMYTRGDPGLPLSRIFGITTFELG
ncbi:MAG: GNAT family N-acetyltransferase [Geminicoccaceae bacterium]|nr:GNAT family N-acetyltransferase [Geminicoccaceae bacterium]